MDKSKENKQTVIDRKDKFNNIFNSFNKLENFYANFEKNNNTNKPKNDNDKYLSDSKYYSKTPSIRKLNENSYDKNSKYFSWSIRGKNSEEKIYSEKFNILYANFIKSKDEINFLKKKIVLNKYKTENLNHQKNNSYFNSECKNISFFNNSNNKINKKKNSKKIINDNKKYLDSAYISQRSNETFINISYLSISNHSNNKENSLENILDLDVYMSPIIINSNKFIKKESEKDISSKIDLISLSKNYFRFNFFTEDFIIPDFIKPFRIKSKLKIKKLKNNN